MGIVRIGLVRFGPTYNEIGPGYSMYQYQYQPKHEYRRQYSVPARVSNMYMHMYCISDRVMWTQLDTVHVPPWNAWCSLG